MMANIAIIIDGVILMETSDKIKINYKEENCWWEGQTFVVMDNDGTIWRFDNCYPTDINFKGLDYSDCESLNKPTVSQ